MTLRMRLLHRSAALLLSLTLLQLSLGASEIACDGHHHTGAMPGDVTMPGMAMPAGSHDAHGAAPCTAGVEPGCHQSPGQCEMPPGVTCTSMTACASTLFDPTERLASGPAATDADAAEHALPALSTRTLVPELPPPRA